MNPGEIVVFGKGRQTVDLDGKKSRKRGDSYWWAACDVCGEVVLTKGLPADRAKLAEEKYREKFHRCRLTPKCPGRHCRGAW